MSLSVRKISCPFLFDSVLWGTFTFNPRTRPEHGRITRPLPPSRHLLLSNETRIYQVGDEPVPKRDKFRLREQISILKRRLYRFILNTKKGSRRFLRLLRKISYFFHRVEHLLLLLALLLLLMLQNFAVTL